jgi:hypothetical protein
VQITTILGVTRESGYLYGHHSLQDFHHEDYAVTVKCRAPELALAGVKPAGNGTVLGVKDQLVRVRRPDDELRGTDGGRKVREDSTGSPGGIARCGEKASRAPMSLLIMTPIRVPTPRPKLPRLLAIFSCS